MHPLKRYPRLRYSAGLLMLSVLIRVATGDGNDPTWNSLPSDLKHDTAAGLILLINCRDAETPSRLGRQPGTRVQVLQSADSSLEKIQSEVQRTRLSHRVSVTRFDGRHLPYIDNLVNHILVAQPSLVSEQELLRVLTPGGTAWFRDQGEWNKITKPMPTTTDEWTHFLHGPDNNPVAADQEVGHPNGLQWMAAPLWARDHDTTPTVFGLVSAAGRLFYVLDEGPIGVFDPRIPERHVLVARDAYNGIELWRKRLPSWYPSYVQWGTTPTYLHRRVVAIDDRVFVTDGLNGPVLELDAATGEQLHAFPASVHASEIVVEEGVLIAGIMPLAARPGDEYPSNRSQPFTPAALRHHHRRGTALAAFDLDSGEPVWRKPMAFIPLMFCADQGQLFVSTDDGLSCLDLKTGQKRWSQPSGVAKLMVHDDVLVVAARPQGKRWTPRLTVQARAVSDGRLLWETVGSTLPTFANLFYIPPEIFVANHLVWIQSPQGDTVLGLDLKTGEMRRSIPTAGGFTPGHHVRCYPAKATDCFAMFNKRGIEFLDFVGDDAFTKHDWIRGTCRLGILPCNGLIYAPPNGCNCCIETYVRGFLALKSQPTDGAKIDAAERLVHGPAYGQPLSSQAVAASGDWPAFRHDATRRSATNETVSPPFRIRWKRRFTGPITSATSARGLLYISELDTRTVHALDRLTGELAWSYQADGRVDSPPTLVGDYTVFGARDGRVYCLKAADGELVWRFQAAPHDRCLVAFDQLESVWPCHGSVLVQDDVVYVTAGRSSYLDGGLYLHGLDLQSGKVVYQQHLEAEQPQATTLDDTFNNYGVLTDILVAQNDHLFMRQMKFDRQLKPLSGSYPFDDRNQAEQPRVMATSGFLDDAGNKRVYRACATHWTGRYSPLRTQQLAVNDRTTYGCRMHYDRGWKSPRYHPGDGTLVFALDHTDAAQLSRTKTVEAAVKGNSHIWPFSIPHQSFRWEQRLPLVARAAVLAGDRLLIAGRADRSVADLMAEPTGERSGLLTVLSAAGGKILDQCSLPASPVLDGMIVARQHIYLSTMGHELICLESKP